MISDQLGSTATPTTSPTYGSTPTLTAIPTEEAPEPLQSAKYFYDGDGNLVKSVVNSTLGNTTTTYFPGKHYSVEEKNGALKVQKHYTAGSTIIAVRTVTAEADTLQWMISDQLGSTTTTANADGTWNSDIRYTAFGEIRLKTGVTASGYRYTGQLDMQGSIGLDYYVARFYDPQLARFAQADSLVPEPGKSVSFDRYAYVSNNPIRYNDPSGHDGIPYSDLIPLAIDFFSQTINGAWKVLGDPASKSPNANGADIVFFRDINNSIEVLTVEIKDIIGNVNLGTLGFSSKFQDYGGSVTRNMRSAARFIESANEQLRLESELIRNNASNLQNALFTNAKGVSENAMNQFNGVYTNARNGVESIKPLVLSSGASAISRITSAMRVLSSAPFILVPVKVFKDFLYTSKREQVILRKLDRLERRSV